MQSPPAVLTFPFLDERAREDAHEASQADQLHGELLQDLVHGAVELGTARVPRVLNHLGQPEHRNGDVVGIPAGGAAPQCTADRQSGGCAPPHTGTSLGQTGLAW